MTDWNELFRSDDFRAYRKKQVEAIAKDIHFYVDSFVYGDRLHGDVIAGQLATMRTLLRLPEKITGDEKMLEQLEAQLQEDIGNITTYLMREALRDPD